MPSQRETARPLAHQLVAVRGEEGVGVLDVVEVAQDRLGGRGCADSAEEPLQVADPEHELGYGDRARVLFQAEELVRIDAGAGEGQAVALTRGHVGQRVQHLALQALHHLHGDVEEVAGAACRVEHPDGAEAGVEFAQGCRGGVAVAGFQLPVGGGFEAVPFGAQRLHHGG